jgi:hypothetical protein
VVGGFAIIQAGYARFTDDLDLLVDASVENERLVFEALRCLPDQAVNQLEPGDVEKFVVVRVGDEILVNLYWNRKGINSIPQHRPTSLPKPSRGGSRNCSSADPAHAPFRVSGIRYSDFLRISFGFRYSDFGFRISDLGFRIWLRLRHPAYVRAGHGVSPFWA